MPCAKPLAALLALLALPAGAGPAAGPLEQAALSARLYAAGEAAGDAVLVAAAAQMRRQAGLQAGLGDGMPLDWTDMLDRAEALAGGDAALQALVLDLRETADKGVASGPEYRLAALAAGASETLPPMEFRGGEYAEAYVEAAPGIDLNLTVLDAAGHEVCADTDRSHVAYCGWTPATDGAFTLVVRNAGTAETDYALMTN